MESTSSKLDLFGSLSREKQPSRVDIIFKKRYIHSAMMALCLVVAYLNRINLSVAIVSMTDKKSSNENFYEFDWNEREKGILLSSFFWGYVITQIPAGQIAQFISPKLLLGITNLISTILAALTPAASYFGGWQLLTGIRVAEGVCQGFIPSLMFKMASNWCPPSERSRLLGFSLSGAIAAPMALPIFGSLAHSAGGWPAIFYFTAILNLLWTINWAWIGADSPTTHKTISSEEKIYVETSLLNCKDFGRKMKTPWVKIFTSIPFWSLLLTQMCEGFGRNLLLNELPSFIDGILKVGIAANGFLSGCPYYISWLFVFPTCWLADYLIKSGILSKSAVRKLWTTLSMSASCLLILFIGFCVDNSILAIILLVVAFILHAFIFSSFLITPLDMTPNFAGVLHSIINTAESLAGLFAPIVVGLVVDNPVSFLDQSVMLSGQHY
ncbi:putative inorganic phosphate cotransporter isoform X2 [Rhodnius prolixus]|uniref:putative inorganic phosphate cotransporter isoform X2 n=1 Tax=Rhodnius prolixus TaxID=13249 RepID=UPI003D189E5C